MNKCNKFREVLLTDYWDKEINNELRSRVESHLNACPECRQFAEEIRSHLERPFEHAVREKVPDRVWVAIKEEIENEKDYKDVATIEFTTGAPATSELVITSKTPSNFGTKKCSDCRRWVWFLSSCIFIWSAKWASISS